MKAFPASALADRRMKMIQDRHLALSIPRLEPCAALGMQRDARLGDNRRMRPGVRAQHQCGYGAVTSMLGWQAHAARRARHARSWWAVRVQPLDGFVRLGNRVTPGRRAAGTR